MTREHEGQKWRVKNRVLDNDPIEFGSVVEDTIGWSGGGGET